MAIREGAFIMNISVNYLPGPDLSNDVSVIHKAGENYPYCSDKFSDNESF